jgi:hypothetical protein
MREALPDGLDGLGRRASICESCGRVVVTTVEAVFNNPTAVAAPEGFCPVWCRRTAYRRGGLAEGLPRQRRAGRGRRPERVDRLAVRGNRVSRK